MTYESVGGHAESDPEPAFVPVVEGVENLSDQTAMVTSRYADGGTMRTLIPRRTLWELGEEAGKEKPHVDLIVTDFSAMQQVRIACLRPYDDEISVQLLDTSEPPFDFPDSLVDPETGERVDKQDPERYLGLLSSVWHGSVFAATSAHVTEDCPYVGSNERPFLQHLSPSD